jgi:hypothetical protein
MENSLSASAPGCWLGCAALFLMAALAQPLWAFELPKEAPQGTVILTVSGKIGVKNSPGAALFDAALLDALPQHSFVSATPWLKNPATFTGPLLKDVLKALKAQGTHLKALALNDYKSDIPLDDAFKFDVILARKVDGRVLTVREKGPIFVMYPFERFPELKTDIYYSRCVWQLKSLSVE